MLFVPGPKVQATGLVPVSPNVQRKKSFELTPVPTALKVRVAFKLVTGSIGEIATSTRGGRGGAEAPKAALMPVAMVTRLELKVPSPLPGQK